MKPPAGMAKRAAGMAGGAKEMVEGKLRQLLIEGNEALMEAVKTVRLSKLSKEEKNEVLNQLQKVKETFWKIAEEVGR